MVEWRYADAPGGHFWTGRWDVDESSACVYLSVSGKYFVGLETIAPLVNLDDRYAEGPFDTLEAAKLCWLLLYGGEGNG